MDRFPQTFRVRQQLSGPRVEDIEAVVAAELTRVGLQEKVQPGQTVAITAGSRGIAQIRPDAFFFFLWHLSLVCTQTQPLSCITQG